MLPAGEGRLRIEGALPGTGWLAGQTLDISAYGQRLGRLSVAPGDFSIELPIPERLRGQALELVIGATHRYIPAYCSTSRDFRQLSYRLRRVCWAEPESTAHPVPAIRTAANAS
jgi:hypothetical protein